MATVAPHLAAYVSRITAYDTDFGAPGVHRGLPSTAVSFVLPTHEPLDCGWAGVAGSRRQGWSTVSGLHSRPAEIHHDGHQRGLQLDLTTAGARALLGVPAAELSREILDLDDLDDLDDAALRELPERIHGLAGERATAVVVQALTGALARHGAAEARAEVGRALRGLTRGEPVSTVAAEVGYSRRRLSTLVRAETGLSPKEYQRVARFEASRRLVGHRPLAVVAATCGFADQAHLSREWSRLAGCTPTTWLREEFPFVQDLGGPTERG